MLSESLNESMMRTLAGQDETESRLIRRRGRKWRLDHGPFEPTELPEATDRRWTLLVQGVDQHLDQASDLLHRFNFLPQVRLDDLMISIAGDQGGVGPHTDSYDVFLVQLEGVRQWTLGAPGDYPLQANQPLKLIESFEPLTTLTLAPGDMLYVPPGWIHDGIAQGCCTTASVGFRAPARTEVLSAWLQSSADRVVESSDDVSVQYGDAQPANDGNAARTWRRLPGQIPPAMDEVLQSWINDWKPGKTEIKTFIGCYLTEPHASVWFDRPPDSQLDQFETDAKRNGVKLDRRTRISFRERSVFINGEAFATTAPLPAELKTLANGRSLNAAACAALWAASDESIDWLTQWFEAGWLQPQEPG